MCTVCGCSGDGATISDATGGHAHAHPHEHGEGHSHAHGEAHVHTHADGTTHSHGHGHDRGHHHDHAHHPAGGTLDYGSGPARAHAPGLSQARMVEIETSILAKNDDYASRNRARFEAAGLLALNLLSGPGAGKTTLLVETLKALAGRLPTAVIEGDQQTDNDAARIRAAGAPAVQINTGKGCHLDAHMVGHAVEKLPLPPGGVLFIENVGNLVCPAAFDLGETRRVTLISVAEGDDKPLKYPDIFEGADLVLITKADLAPHVDADMAQLEANIRRVNPRAEILRVSARGEVGLSRWLAWLEKARAERLDALAAARESEAQALRAAIGGGAR
ncbi:hydrogenase nickel incorporation protein HypB [Xanthobacter autotrophicus]|uniref:hydrogenase nickel incorporation protein HypB n=1 Tax=Xanthobacter TaxID=279 RepID=UPI0024AA8E59|nr:hydrogenase nickel incorporation protein HypB [Xanthobacter autotrophicus]MDI4666007.1 hydrogenase nickel incorporation protein HypB [Xanthobacter autotrophicus]